MWKDFQYVLIDSAGAGARNLGPRHPKDSDIMYQQYKETKANVDEFRQHQQ